MSLLINCKITKTHISAVCILGDSLPVHAGISLKHPPPPPIKDRGFIEFVYRVTSTVLQLAVHDFSGLLCGSGELKLQPCFLLRGLKRFFMFCPSNIVQRYSTTENTQERYIWCEPKMLFSLTSFPAPSLCMHPCFFLFTDLLHIQPVIRNWEMMFMKRPRKNRFVFVCLS